MTISARRTLIGLGLTAVLLLIVATGCGGGAMSSGTTPPVTPPSSGALALGSVTTATPVSCASENGADKGVPNGTCFDITVACPDVADEALGIKVNFPSGTSKGTVLFTTGGGGGPDWYDQQFTYGTTAIQMLQSAGFTTAQLNFWETPTGFPQGGTFAGWLTGPGGPLHLACRWATVAKYLHDTATVTPANSAFCATGNSGGAGAAAYAVAHFGEDSMFDMLEETSGPPYTRIDKGCLCNSPAVQTPCVSAPIAECFAGDAQMFIDPAYNPLGNECSSAETTHTSPDTQTFLNDSIMGSSPVLSYPNTYVHFLFGGQDTTTGVALAQEWLTQITAKNGPGTGAYACVADAPHMLPNVLDGATTIANDIIANCHK